MEGEQSTLVSRGIPLQICDIFLQELNKSDSLNISYENLSAILDPFLYSIAHSSNKIIVERIIEKVFTPLLENNITQQSNNEESENSDDEDNKVINYDPKKGKYIDGGKLPPKTQKEIQQMLD